MTTTSPENYSLGGKKAWVAGHSGMVGSAIVRRLNGEDCDVVTVPRAEVDLRKQSEVKAWLEANRPDVVFLAAATVGGILANDSRPAEFIYNNLAIEANIIHGAYKVGVEKLLFLGSSCIYPRNATQPMTEDCLLTGALEPTNQWYAVAKIAGIKMCQAYRRQYGCDFISAMPTNLYGPGDNYDLESSHVIPALIAKTHLAKERGEKEISIWGTGRPRREFLFVDDLADACVYLTKHYSDEGHVNVGTGADLSITELAGMIAEVVGFEGEFVYDHSKPDGTPRKLLDVSLLTTLGWRAETGLRAGLGQTFANFLENEETAASRS